MANERFIWAHVMCSTRGAWLPGDERGFRSRRHRVHSSGDYKHPPPIGEHAGLRRYARSISRRAVEFPVDVRRDVAIAMAEKLTALGVRPWIIGVAADHVHGLVEVGRSDAKRLLGQAKQVASRRVRDRLPGRIWGQGCHVVRVRSEAHFVSIEAYVARHEAREDAFVWRSGDPDLRVRSGQASALEDPGWTARGDRLDGARARDG